MSSYPWLPQSSWCAQQWSKKKDVQRFGFSFKLPNMSFHATFWVWQKTFCRLVIRLVAVKTCVCFFSPNVTCFSWNFEISFFSLWQAKRHSGRLLCHYAGLLVRSSQSGTGGSDALHRPTRQYLVPSLGTQCLERRRDPWWGLLAFCDCRALRSCGGSSIPVYFGFTGFFDRFPQGEFSPSSGLKDLSWHFLAFSGPGYMLQGHLPSS